MKKNLLILSILCIAACQAEKNPIKNKSQVLNDLKSKQILVAMWGWDAKLLAPAAKNAGYEVVVKPGGNNLNEHKKEFPIWQKYGFEMLVRPHLFAVNDPFDEQQISNGYSELEKVIKFHEKYNSNVVGYVIMWGFLGEGGFLPNYKFSEKAKKAFNDYMKTPGMPLPEQPSMGMPGNLRWVEWLKFRSKKLADFRQDYVMFAKKFTDKLVGTWSEFYAVDNYALNMGDAPGSDFLFYDLSFGDVTVNQKLALAESHGNMETFSTFEKWRDYILPLMAHAAGQGVTPMSFQFPMTRNSGAQGNTNRKKYYVDKIEDEYSLKIGPYMKKIINAALPETNFPDVCLVYDSFQAGAMPADKWSGRVLWPYYFGTKQIESSMSQMGVNMRIIPYEWLENYDLSKYKIVIIPDPMYLNVKMKENLMSAKRILYSGEYLLTYRNVKTQKGNYTNEFHAITYDPRFGRIKYFKNNSGKIKINRKNAMMKNVDFPKEKNYPGDQMFTVSKYPANSVCLARVNGKPVIFTTNNGREIFVANRAFAFAWTEKNDWLEKGMFQFLKNVLKNSGVKIRVESLPQVRANLSYAFGSYGVTGNLAWNTTDKDIRMKMSNGRKIIIPKHGWAIIGNQ
ncbi:MAG: hypothetical protein DRI44_03075 [Chlamydiae bacterium]|nr:MAG: hypothetical protein DRI44_03075 [Chlamydiota bacterium]